MFKIEKQATPYIITLELNSVELNSLFDDHWEKIKDDIEIDGFRKGCASKEIAEKTIGFDKLYSKLIPNIYLLKIKEENLDIAYSSEPKIYGKFLRDGYIKVVTECYFSPKVKLGCLDDLKIEKPTIFVDEYEIENSIDVLKRKHSQLIEADKSIDKNSTIDLDFTGYLDGNEIAGAKAKNYRMIVGKSNMVAGFEDSLIGLCSGDTKTFTVSFPQDYHRKELSGKNAEFKIKINTVFDQNVCLDELLKCESCATYEELIYKVKEDLLKEKEEELKKKLSVDILKQLVSISEIEPIPNQCVHHELDQKLEQFVLSSGKTIDELKEQFPNFEVVFENNNKESIIDGIRSTLVLQEYQKMLEINISEEDIQNICISRYGKTYEKETPQYMISESQLKIQLSMENLIKHYG